MGNQWNGKTVMAFVLRCMEVRDVQISFLLGVLRPERYGMEF